MDWYANLPDSKTRAEVRKYSGDQIQEMKRTGQWERVQQQFSTSATSRYPNQSRDTSTSGVAHRIPTAEELDRTPVDRLSRMPSDQLANLTETRRRQLNNYVSGLSEADRYAREAEQWNRKADAIDRGLDRAQVGVGAAGLVPGVGNAADLANAGISALRGDKAGAAGDLAAAIPGAGGVAGAAGIARRVDKVAGVANVESHHLFPQQFKSQFERAGIDIEQHKVDLSRSQHRLKPDGLHTGTDNWNANWRQFFQQNPSATRGQIFQQLLEMKQKFGID
jgi:hypothetical protein